MPSDDPLSTESFVSVLTQHQTHLLGFIRASLGNRGNAEDVLQQTNLALWRKSAQFDPEADFLPWAITFARFEIMAFLRDNSRDRMVFDSDVVELMTGIAAEQMPSVTRRQEALQKCLKQLKFESRSIMEQKYLKGMQVKEISQIVGRSTGAIKTRLLRTRRMLADCVRRSLKEESL